MIRIDEIYCNTFVPALQDLTGVGLHWFDPFGTTGFENICSVPPVGYHDAIHRVVFWDQEPCHPELITEFFDKFIKVFRGNNIAKYPVTLVTSEHNSEYVQQICDTYDLKSQSYFFHGWAALDWYRGYNRTFLIKPPDQRRPTKTFLSPNRIIAGRRQHRIEMLYWIFKSRLGNNHISCPVVCPAENISIYDLAKQLPYHDAETVFDSANLPRHFAGETDHPMHSCWLSLFEEAADSLLYLVTETVATGQRYHLTEKTFKPIAMGMPFVLLGTRGSLKYLRSYGFQTFEGIWDESYDDAEDHVRAQRIASLLRSLDELTPAGRQDLFEQCIPVIKHNWNHFYNGGFEQILWQELSDMLRNIRAEPCV
jgi:hypothetical protein